MTELDLFTAIEQDETGGLFVWGNYTIYWNAVTDEGELYRHHDFCAAGNSLSALAAKAVELDA